jgi:Rhs element Vgr protein
MPTTDHALCSFSSTALPTDSGHPTLLVVDWRGEEGLSKPYRFEVRLACDASIDNYEILLGKRATLMLSDDVDAAVSKYHGVVTEVEQLDSDKNYYYYQVVLEPKLVLLRQFHFSDIWLDHKLQALVADVLGNLNFKQASSRSSVGADDDYLMSLTESVATREVPFICQFEESSFDFLSRRLEQAGVYYYFEQHEQQELLVLCNNEDNQSSGEPVTVSYCPASTTRNSITTAVLRTFKKRVTRPVKRVALQDFTANIVNGMATLPGDSVAGSPSGSNYIAYGEHYTKAVDGDELATLRAQALSCREEEVHGSGRMTSLRAGGQVTFTSMTASGDQRQDLARSASAGDSAVTYYLIEVKHSGSQPLPKGDDQNTGNGDINTGFIALPLGVQYRPLCSTPRPYMGAPLSAFIDAEDEAAETAADEKIAGGWNSYTLNTGALETARDKYHLAEVNLSVKADTAGTAKVTLDTAQTALLHLHTNGNEQAVAVASRANTDAIENLRTAGVELSAAKATFDTANKAVMDGTAAMSANLKAVSTPYLDGSGRYKLRFPFIRKDKAGTRCSAFVRMATLSSGLEHGMNFPLLPGAEVLVAFLGGDPDRPIIIGSVPNEVNINKVVDANKTQSGFSTPGGHFFAVDDSAPVDPTDTAKVDNTSDSTGTPETRLLKIGTPAGQASLTLGNGEVNGAYLRTADHLQFSSSSLKQYVPNIYGLSVGTYAQSGFATTKFYELDAAEFNNLLTSADNQGEVKRPGFVEGRGKAAEDNLTSQWGGIPWAVPCVNSANGVMTARSGRKDVKGTLNENLSFLSAVTSVGVSIMKGLHLGNLLPADSDPTVDVQTCSIQVNNASVQTSAHYGVRKEELNDFTSTLAYNYRGEKAEVNIGKGTYTYDTYRKEESTAHFVKTTSHSITAVVQSVDATRVGITTECYSLNGLLVTEIKGHNHKIIMSDKGVMIESVGMPILLKGDVAVSGSLLVKNDLLVEGRADIQQALSSEKFHTGGIACSQIKSITGKLADSNVPGVRSVYAQGVANFNNLEKTNFNDSRSFIGKKLHWVVWGANKAMQAEGIVLNTKAASLGSETKPPEVTATIVYRGQAMVQSLSHKVAMARALVAFVQKQLSSDVPTGKLTDGVVKWMD